ncbi:HAD-IIB family hydrolase [Lactiplantibacillus mudanjiangensis]|uniref:Cof-type HAD-IIB family hydrolase [Lactobacillus sp.] n=1 Tax=Lactiplantibacillus mudanjiangensis TaxID=1296538 RepID=A0A660E1I9_9LACO|nr:HAD family hydrolase [Lactiplantibacillus mudanjiangensis]VDG21234.1 Cof-type HAD-IIB family hydrolase [Lactobacillus sp.] [Lactiplantibacillus mudanjiangensis]VDG22818.1 Cof-type HAD-IIB family hydrolase [Lactobacillus sp.] [Lactiplantibacillus mudanjiangensis]VDG26610.1 Cof-type HAD-IIB family hydrolase [Lactobacillus sp.] [Lactiplantibacillus mudanjiangensis]VDG31844.1 Cof-type HAD-IIB family hydrolase [Lactobacillus sp.] [Lactiplantibacillus mudanjiangensis]
MTYLICSDVDGALMVNHTMLTPNTHQTLKQVIAQGHQVYLVSGRMLPLARQAANNIDPAVKVIAADGATYEQGNNLVNAHLTNKQLKTIYQITLSNHCRVYFFETNRIYYTGDKVPYEAAATQAHMNLPAELSTMPLIGPEFLTNLGDHITNAIVYGEPTNLALVRQLLVDLTNLNLTSADHHLEVVPAHIDRATALAAIQRVTGIDRAHTIVFGSTLDDLGMFKLADHSVAMGNANLALKQAATDVTLANDQDGIAVFLQDFFNLNENRAHG